MKISSRGASLLLFLVGMMCGLAAFGPQLLAQNSNKSSAKGEILIRNSSDGTVYHDAKQDIYRITKGVRVTQRGEDFILYTDDLTYYRKSNQALAKDGVRVESRESTIRGARMQANFAAKTIVFLDDVTLNARGPSDGIQTGTATSKMRSELRQKPIQVLCDRVDYNYENRQAIAVGNIRIRQDGGRGTCDRIVYDEDRNIARLLGNVSFTNSEGQTFKGDEVTVWADDDKIDGRGPSTIVGPPEEENAEAPKPAKVPFGESPKLPDEFLNEFRPLNPLSADSPLDRRTTPASGNTDSTADTAPVSEGKPAARAPAKTAAKN